MPSWNLPWTYRSRSKVSPVHNPAFWDWFRGSVVRNPDGSPRIVYHGTTARSADWSRQRAAIPDWYQWAAFTTFRVSDEDIGIHFGTREQATERTESPYQHKGIIYPVYLSLQNPLRMPDVGSWWAPALAERLERWPHSPPKPYKILSRSEVEAVLTARNRIGYNREGNEAARKKLVEILRGHRYDGIVYQNMFEGNRKDDSYIVFDPTQIKSAYGNRGTFDPDDPDILHGL